MQNMENAAADVIAKALKGSKTPNVGDFGKDNVSGKAETAKPNPLERMVDIFCDNYARNIPTTERDLWQDGISKTDIETFLPQARAIAAERMNLA